MIWTRSLRTEVVLRLIIAVFGGGGGGYIYCSHSPELCLYKLSTSVILFNAF